MSNFLTLQMKAICMSVTGEYSSALCSVHANLPSQTGLLQQWAWAGALDPSSPKNIIELLST